jgi:hypothetical protein
MRNLSPASVSKSRPENQAGKYPSTNNQPPEKLQTSSTKRALVIIGTWMFSGAWSLVLGAYFLRRRHNNYFRNQSGSRRFNSGGAKFLFAAAEIFLLN